MGFQRNKNNSPLLVKDAYNKLENLGLLPPFEKVSLRLGAGGNILYAGFAPQGSLVGFNVNRRLDGAMMKSAIKTNEENNFLTNIEVLDSFCDSLMIGHYHIQWGNPYRGYKSLLNEISVFLNSNSKRKKQFKEQEKLKVLEVLHLVNVGLGSDFSLKEFLRIDHEDLGYPIRLQWCLDVANSDFDDYHRHAYLMLEGVENNMIQELWDYPNDWLVKAGSRKRLNFFNSPSSRYTYQQA